MADDEIPSDLTLASDEQLIEELSRRARSSNQHGMILVYGRPTEGNPENSDGFITVSAQSSDLIQLLLGILLRRFCVHGLPDGRIQVPEIRLLEGGELVTDEPLPEPEDLDDRQLLEEFLLGIQGVEQCGDGSLACRLDLAQLHDRLLAHGFRPLFRDCQDGQIVCCWLDPYSEQLVCYRGPATSYLSGADVGYLSVREAQDGESD